MDGGRPSPLASGVPAGWLSAATLGPSSPSGPRVGRGGLAAETERRGVVRGVEDDERALDKLSFPVAPARRLDDRVERGHGTKERGEVDADASFDALRRDEDRASAGARRPAGINLPAAR